MSRVIRWVPGVGALSAVLVACTLVGCGGSETAGKGGSPETVGNARATIEALHYPIRLTEPPSEDGVLVGHVKGGLGEHFAFFLFVNRRAPNSMPGVPGYSAATGRYGGGGELTDAYAYFSRERPVAGESRRQFQQQSNIESEVEEALCKQSTGELCGI